MMLIPGSTLKVFPLCLGTADMGTRIPRDTAFGILDAYAAAGGNFLDTANVYAEWLPGGRGASETLIGDWLAARRRRRAFVIGTKGARKRTILEFEAFKPFVRTGSYIVVENTILNGNPVWASFGMGPHEAVRQLMVDHRDFTPDISIDKRYPAGFNPGGWLKRVRNSAQGDTLT